MRKIKFRGINYDTEEVIYYDGDINYNGEIESFAIKRQAAALNDKLARDARLGFSKSVFDLLPEVSELRSLRYVRPAVF